MNKTELRVTFGPCDSLNPGFGYQIRIESSVTGQVLLFTSTHPVTGEPLDFSSCLEVASFYAESK